MRIFSIKWIFPPPLVRTGCKAMVQLPNCLRVAVQQQVAFTPQQRRIPPSHRHPHPLWDFRSSRSKVSGSYSPPHAETDWPRFPPRGKSAATNTAPARKQIGCLMTAVIFETLSLKSAPNHRLNLYGHQAAPGRAGRAIPVVRLGNGSRTGWDCLIASRGKICAGV